MALPLDDRQINDIVTTTLQEARKELIDAFFVSNALLVRLMSKDKVTSEGGEEIRSNFVYDEMDGGSYGKGDPFGANFKEFMTAMRLRWKRNRAEFSLDGLDVAVNRGASKVIDFAMSVKDNAKRSLLNKIGYQLYGDGSGNNSKDIDGLKIAINDTGTYGGIVRSATGPGAAIKSVVNTAGGPYNNAMVQSAIGSATFGRDTPDLIITTQAIFDKIWTISQTSERNTAEDMRRVGFKTVEISGVPVVVDQHCPAGEMYILNTDFLEWRCQKGKEMYLRGPFDLHLTDASAGQYIQYSNLVCTGPRYQTRIENIT